MQTLGEIRQMLDGAGLRPNKRLGQHFLVDKNLMAKLLDLAALSGRETVLEVGPGTGSLTEELLARARRVVAVEIDRGLFEALRCRLGPAAGLVLIRRDVLAAKHRLSPRVAEALGRQAVLVANLPYDVAAPLVSECLIGSALAERDQSRCRFDSLTFTVQKELAERMTAAPGGGDYGPISVIVALLGRVSKGPSVPASAFWPRPKVAGRMLRIDFNRAAAAGIGDVEVLVDVVRLAFSQRRKQIHSISRRKPGASWSAAVAEALQAAGISRASRPECIPPGQYAALADALAAGRRPRNAAGNVNNRISHD